MILPGLPYSKLPSCQVELYYSHFKLLISQLVKQLILFKFICLIFLSICGVFFIIFISQSYLSADEFPIERRNLLVTTGRLTGPSVCLTSIGIDKKWNFCHISWLLQILNFQLGEKILISFNSRQQVIPSSHLLILWDFYIFWDLIKHKIARVQNKGFEFIRILSFEGESPEEIVLMPAATFYLLCDLAELFLPDQNIHMADHAILASSSLSLLLIFSWQHNHHQYHHHHHKKMEM